jgi:hypothetical protein
MRDVVIAREYLTRGMREAAEEVLTQRLGPRRDLEIAQARAKDVEQDRWTAIDRDIETHSEGSVFKSSSAKAERDRFDRSLRLARIRHLQTLGLAKPAGAQTWSLSSGWQDKLKRKGRRGDIIRTLSSTHGEMGAQIRFIEDRKPDAGPVRGTVKDYGPEDELRDTRFLLIEDFEGGIWHVPSGAVDMTAPPPRGAVVELTRTRALARVSDQTIATITEKTGGIWSEAIHARHDPGSSAQFRLSHKRRLEALRRAGIVQRLAGGEWQIGECYLERAAAYEAQRSGGTKLSVLSWLSPEHQVRRKADTWLDGLSEDEIAGSRSLVPLSAARQTYLRAQGLINAVRDGMSDDQRTRLRLLELKQQSEAIATRSNRSALSLEAGDQFAGKFESHVDLAQGRMAIIGNAKEFTLVPWRQSLGRQIGRDLIVARSAKGLSWTMVVERARGLSR